jgi:hypothetical protein
VAARAVTPAIVRRWSEGVELAEPAGARRGARQ